MHILLRFKLDERDSNNNSSKNGSSNGIRGMFNSLSLSLIDDPRTIFEYNLLKFYCMYCGKEHKKRKCPSCGSMAVRAA
jgi:rubrerythrin